MFKKIIENNINNYLKQYNETQQVAVKQLLNELLELIKENRRIKEELERNSLIQEIKRANKYRTALEETREYIQSLNKDICNNCGWHNTDGCSPNGYVCHDLIEIQNKINEVLKEGE